MGRPFVLVLMALLASSLTPGQTAPVKMTAQEDHQRMMKLLGIASIRQGANGSNPQAPNYAN